MTQAKVVIKKILELTFTKKGIRRKYTEDKCTYN